MDRVEPLRILVIEDDLDTRANLCDILELDDHRVEAAGSAAEALARDDWASFSAIILDRKLPDATADELLPRLRRMAPDAAVIVVTGYADLQGAIAALRQGATDYILKPIEPDGLRARLRQIAELRRAQEARRAADAAMRRERDFAEGLIEAAPAMVLVLEAEGHIVRLNRFAEELCGYRSEEILGRDFFATLVPARDRARIREVFRRSLDEVDSRDIVNAIVTKDGREREVRWSNRALRDGESNISGVLAIGQDITDLKEAQGRALRAERLAAIGQTVAGLAHESRNALQRSQACLEMLALQVRDRPEALGLIARLQGAQDHLHHLYEDVRGYAAPIRLERHPCDLAEIWREAWAHLEPQRRGRSAALRDQCDEPDLRCAVDSFRLGQVFHNIFENALAACPDPVEVQIRCSRAEIDGRPAIRVIIRDNGPGIRAEDRQRVFEPFYTTKTKGTGLGMAIARRIIEAHGGRIDAGEGTGQGAEFVITLPRGEP